LDRAAHWQRLSVPTLLIQGTRDKLAEPKLIQQIVRRYSPLIALSEIQGADHGFAVLKSSGRSTDAVLAEIATEAARFIRRCLKHP
jgi:predicted alpha/beta-hydrolase family hydrolase